MPDPERPRRSDRQFGVFSPAKSSVCSCLGGRGSTIVWSIRLPPRPHSSREHGSISPRWQQPRRTSPTQRSGAPWNTQWLGRGAGALAPKRVSDSSFVADALCTTARAHTARSGTTQETPIGFVGGPRCLSSVRSARFWAEAFPGLRMTHEVSTTPSVAQARCSRDSVINDGSVGGGIPRPQHQSRWSIRRVAVSASAVHSHLMPGL
jgi:hypothetical protein